jgi:hypothetical protein
MRFIAPILLIALLAINLRASAAETGEQIYKRLCASCHGEKGEGVADQYPNPLAGDRSVKELAAYIDKSMPHGEPEACGAEESTAVAEFIYDAFYSPIAQARNSPARIELSRLTVRQYQNAVADLIASFREENGFTSERGLRASYYNARNLRNDKKVIERRDDVVNFNFGELSPDKEKIGVEEFAGKWEGSLYAPETCEYEMILRTENGAKLFLNEMNEPLIDAWVRSGPDNEFKASIKLLGGRVYPIRVEFFKFKEKTASISLRWKLPHRESEVVPNRYLLPNGSRETFIVTTPFPPDDRSVGYERGSAISKAWEAATTDAAIETSEYITPRLQRLAGVKLDEVTDQDGARKKLREFCRKFTERAFRHPLSDEEAAFYVDRMFENAPDMETSAKRAIILTLKSPRFLYREPEANATQFDIASKLAFAIWDAPPDRQLWDAAVQGKLAKREEIAAQAQRMLQSPRTRAKMREFFEKWLKLDHLTDVAKDTATFPGFTPEIISDLRTSLDLWIDEIVWSKRPDFRRLFTEDSLFLNGRLAQYYGVELYPDSDFQQIRYEPELRSGVLTHPYLLAGFAYTSSTSPIHRGVFISRNILGRMLRPPPEAVSPLTADLHPELTTRDRVELQTKAESCQSCHSMINPLGFTLEQFDPVGRFRATERGKPVNPLGRYITRKGDEVSFSSVRGLATFLANSEESHSAFTEQLFHHLVKQPIRAYGPEMSKNLKESFAKNDFDIQQLIVDISTAAAEYRPPTP